MSDRRGEVERAAVRAVTQYEQSLGREVRSVERGRTREDHEAVAAALRTVGADPDLPWSFDLLSTAGSTPPRFIEVKGRGRSGPLRVLDREYDFAARVGEHAVLAAVWFAGDQPYEEVWIAQDWTHLPWDRTADADPKRAEDSTFFQAFGLRDRRSRGQRALDAEGEWQLTPEALEAGGHRVVEAGGPSASGSPAS